MSERNNETDESRALTQLCASDATPHEDNTDEMREELIRLSEEGRLERTVAYLKKANKKSIKRIHAGVQGKRLAKTNEFIAEIMVSKWAGILGSLGVVKDPNALGSELGSDELLRNDLVRAVGPILPYIPLPGVLSGGITTVIWLPDCCNIQ